MKRAKRLFAIVALSMSVLGSALPAAAGTLPGPTSSSPSIGPAAVTVYRNCAGLNRKYPHGVGRKGARDRVRGRTRPVTNFKVNTALYNANKARDADKDGVACEKR